jgi:response regulator of citrate/malate metabolism
MYSNIKIMLSQIIKNKIKPIIEDNNILTTSISYQNIDKINCLIIDDCPITRKLHIKYLLSINPNINIEEAYDGIIALEKISNNVNRYDLILLDNSMPNLMGTQLTKLLRIFNYNKLLIAITSDNEQTIIDEFYNNGINYVIIKPLTKKIMGMIINYLNNNKHVYKKLEIINDEFY